MKIVDIEFESLTLKKIVNALAFSVAVLGILVSVKLMLGTNLTRADVVALFCACLVGALLHEMGVTILRGFRHTLCILTVGTLVGGLAYWLTINIVP